MKNLHLITLVILGLCCQNYLQAQKNKKVSIYRTWISLNNQQTGIEGVLYEIRDSSILVSNSLDIKDYYNNNFEVADLSINKIEKIKIRKKNKAVKSILIGTAVGSALGAIIGYADGDDPPSSGFSLNYTAEAKAALGAIGWGIFGAGIGTLIAFNKVKIPINGNRNIYNQNKKRLEIFSIKKE